ncbi:MAG: hypothetical protein ACP5IO_03400 [Elusimicrobiales bacterium]
MNFYKMRLLNTILFFIVGILLGIYLGVEKDYFKGFFNRFDSYKSIYYKRAISNKKTDNYNPVYSSKKRWLEDLDKKDDKSNKVKDYKILESLKGADNPMEDDFEFTDSTDISKNDNAEINVCDFVMNSLNFAGRTVRAENAFLIRTEKKDGKTIFFFTVSVMNKEYYLIIEGNERYLDKDYGKGIYDVRFISDDGLLVEGNRLVSINFKSYE